MALGAMGPSGEFSCFREPAQRYLFISGGSGITPLMSMTRALHDLGSDADIVFVHCARTPADLLFPEELTLAARNIAHLRLAMVCDHHTPGSAYAGHLGRMDAARLAHIAPDFLTRDVYTCGPAPFMGVVRALMAGAGYAMERYREESFSFESLPAQVVQDIPGPQDNPGAVSGGHRAHLPDQPGKNGHLISLPGRPDDFAGRGGGRRCGCRRPAAAARAAPAKPGKSPARLT